MLKRERQEDQKESPETRLIRELDRESRIKREEEKKFFIKEEIKAPKFTLGEQCPTIDYPFKRSKRILNFNINNNDTDNNDIEQITSELSDTSLDTKSPPSHYKLPKP